MEPRTTLRNDKYVGRWRDHQNAKISFRIFEGWAHAHHHTERNTTSHRTQHNTHYSNVTMRLFSLLLVKAAIVPSLSFLSNPRILRNDITPLQLAPFGMNLGLQRTSTIPSSPSERYVSDQENPTFLYYMRVIIRIIHA